MILQFLWCARCSTAFTFTGTRVEHAQGGKTAIRRLECSALNEIAPNGMSEGGYELYRVVANFTAHWCCIKRVHETSKVLAHRERDPSPRKRQRATSGAAYLKRRILMTSAHGFCLRCRWARPA
jgi:hypothetical protein